MGLYECKAAKTSCLAWLLFFPMIATQTVIQVSIGQTIEIPCGITGTYILPKWIKGSTVLVYQGETTISSYFRDRFAYKADQTTMIVSSLQASDIGGYTCKHTSGLNSPHSTLLTLQGTATLTLVTSAKCGDEAVLTCTSNSCNSSYKFLRHGVTLYNTAGLQHGSDPDRYVANVTSDNQVLLTISNLQPSDDTSYTCSCGFDTISSQQTIQVTCIANHSNPVITSDKVLHITVDRFYPQPSDFLVELTDDVPGTYSCTTLDSYYTCTWVSSTSLPDGHFDYNITIITGTQTVSVTGYVKLVTPTSPTISNLVTTANNRQVIRGVQDTPLTIKCVSRGGIPAPTLALYRGSTSTSPLALSNSSDSVQQSDGTYTVTLIHRFTARRTDDMTTFLCRMFYPGATTGASTDPSPASALLYLDLKPEKPTVSQSGEALSGGKMTVLCISINGRPAPNITWSYRGQTFTPTNTAIYDTTSETYTVESVLQRSVSDADNGHNATCKVEHATLSVPLTGTVTVDVKYPPKVTVSTTTSPPYTVTCAAEGYPDSYAYQDWVQIWPGYGPVDTIPFNGTTLILNDAIYERSEVYVCGASNGVAVYGTNRTIVTGSGTIFPNVAPVLIDTTAGKTKALAGVVGQNVSIEIKYWSYADGSVVSCFKRMRGSRLPSSCCYTIETKIEVKLPVYTHLVSEIGTRTAVTIPITTKSDLGHYDIVVTNKERGESVLKVLISIPGPPSTPMVTRVDQLPKGQVILSVTPGFHGGYNQTLVAQTRTDFKTWDNVTSLKIGQDEHSTILVIENIQPYTMYYVRVFAFNTAGRSNEYSTIRNFTSSKELADKQQEPEPVVYIATTAAVTFCVVLVITVMITVCVCRCCPSKFSERILRPLIVRDAITDVAQVKPASTYETLQQTVSQSVYMELK